MKTVANQITGRKLADGHCGNDDIPTVSTHRHRVITPNVMNDDGAVSWMGNESMKMRIHFDRQLKEWSLLTTPTSRTCFLRILRLLQEGAVEPSGHNDPWLLINGGRGRFLQLMTCVGRIGVNQPPLNATIGHWVLKAKIGAFLHRNKFILRKQYQRHRHVGNLHWITYEARSKFPRRVCRSSDGSRASHFAGGNIPWRWFQRTPRRCPNVAQTKKSTISNSSQSW